ncbi:MAG: hypothetical protein KDD47_11760 [Acidobacteria bacterium]|nr:hypothetical protein [Acidobacteriota bacterium]
MKRYPLVLVGFAFTILAIPPTRAQTTDAAMHAVRDKAALDAGIGKYSLAQEGNVSSVEVFDLDGLHLADCTMRWESKVVTTECLFRDGGHFRHSFDASVPRVEFEDLQTGEQCQVTFIPQESKTFRLEPGESPPSLQPEIIVEGDKTREEMERDWGTVSNQMALVAAEVQTTLGIELSAQEEKPGEIWGGCGPNETLQCGSAGVSETATSLGETRCCSAASQSADVSCSLLTGLTCCANSFCTIHWCLLGVCHCQVSGFLYECVFCS